MTKKQMIEDPNSCLNRSADDEIVFCVCARDMLFGETLDAWIKGAKLEGVNKKKIADAEREAEEGLEWQRINGSKLPD